MIVTRFGCLVSVIALLAVAACGGDTGAPEDPGSTTDPTTLPLLMPEDLNAAYMGGFRLGGYNQRDLDVPETHGWTAVYTLGPLAIAEDGETLFFGGYNGSYDGSTYDSIAQTDLPEFRVPADPTDMSDLAETQPTLLQPWRSILDLPSHSDQGGNTTLTSLLAENGSLYVQAMREYDTTPVTDNLMRIEDAANIAESSVDGWYQVLPDGDTDKGAHAANWITPIPKVWQARLGGTHLFGGGQTFSIISRLPVGPTLSVTSLQDLPDGLGQVEPTVWMDFDLNEGEIFGQRPLQDWLNYYQYNCDPSAGHDCDAGAHGEYDEIVPGSNDLWTLASAAYVGFIVPGTRTYAVIGRSGMHASGGGYKLTRPDGTVCFGPCARDPEDYYNYYWFFDLNEILTVEDMHTLMPYAYGEIEALRDLRDAHGNKAIMSNAHFDLRTGQLLVEFPDMWGNACCETKAAIFGFALQAESLGG